MSTDKRALMMAFEMKRRNSKKKMGDAGTVKEHQPPMSAKSEPRPMPKHMRVEESQPMKPKMQRMAKGGIASSGIFKVRDLDSHEMIHPRGSESQEQHSRMLSHEQHKIKYHEMMKHHEAGEHMHAARMAGEIADEADHGLASHQMADVHEILQAHEAKMAEGGEIHDDLSMAQDEASDDQSKAAHDLHQDTIEDDPSYGKAPAKHNRLHGSDERDMAEGGMIDDEMESEHHSSMAAAIMARRKKMAEGGMVDLESNAEEEPNHEDDESFEALKKENYSESAALDHDQPEDSNEHGDDIDSDKHDMISSIRRKRSRSPMTK